MTTWIAFLRALNVGGRRLTNEELAAAVGECGAGNVRTFLASGNVVFDDASGDEESTVKERLEAALQASLGYDVPSYLRGADAVRTLADLDPFAGLEGSPEGKPQVLLLHSRITSDVAERIEELAPEGELLVPVGREIHWLPEVGISTSSLDHGALEALVGPFTVRTHNTVRRLATKLL